MEALHPSVHVGLVDYDSLLVVDQPQAMRVVVENLSNVGLQATQIGLARQLVQHILHHRARGDKVFLSFTSNLISSGLRDTFAYLAQHRLVDAFIATAGGVEEDVIKCLGNTLMGHFALDGRELRRRGVNRVGNVLVPNTNYCLFEDFFTPVLATLHARQRASQWTSMTAPSDFVRAMGEALAAQEPALSSARCRSSLVYWCYKHDIPFFSPALTDGSIGDMVYFYDFAKKGLLVDPIADVDRLRRVAASETEGRNHAIVLGGGLPKHHLLSNVVMDSVVMVTTGIEADGCTSSGTLRDDVACGLLSDTTRVVRVHGDATLVFPLLLVEERAPGTAAPSEDAAAR